MYYKPHCTTMDPKNIISLDANMWVEVCGEGIIRIWQTNSV